MLIDVKNKETLKMIIRVFLLNNFKNWLANIWLIVKNKYYFKNFSFLTLMAFKNIVLLERRNELGG